MTEKKNKCNLQHKESNGTIEMEKCEIETIEREMNLTFFSFFFIKRLR